MIDYGKLGKQWTDLKKRKVILMIPVYNTEIADHVRSKIEILYDNPEEPQVLKAEQEHTSQQDPEDIIGMTVTLQLLAKIKSLYFVNLHNFLNCPATPTPILFVIISTSSFLRAVPQISKERQKPG